jgi:hypothetical protein
MERDREKVAIAEKLARCRRLARDYPSGITAKNLRELTDELERELRALDP